MRIGVYFRGYAPEVGGGYTFEQNILDALLEAAVDSSHEFVLFSETNSVTSALVLPPGVSCWEIGGVNRLQVISGAFKKFFRCLKWRDASAGKIISPLSRAIHESEIDLLWFLTPAYSPVDIPYIATLWDIQHRVQPWFPEVGRYKEWLQREEHFALYIQRATYVIAPNRAGGDEISFYYRVPAERIITLTHPTPKIILNDVEDVNNILGKYGLEPLNYVLYPAQFWPHKNHINLCIALKALQDKYNLSLPLVLVGSDKGNLSYILSFAKRLGIEKQLLFPGFVPRRDLVALYQGAMALTYVSLFGPENLPPLEAFACDCPVIAARVNGAEDQLGDAALLVDGTDPDEIAQALYRVYSDASLRESLIARGRVRAQAFSANDYVQGVFSLFDRFEPMRRTWGTA